jgi:hypothetical protein
MVLRGKLLSHCTMSLQASNDLSEGWVKVEGQVRVHIKSRADPGHVEVPKHITSSTGPDGANHRFVQSSCHGLKTMHSLAFYCSVFISLMLADTFAQLRDLLCDSSLLCSHGCVRG